MPEASPVPKFLKRDATASGPMRQVGGETGRLLVGGEETNGGFALSESVSQPGSGPPLHVHHREDEHFYVVEGEAKFSVGGKIILASAGDYLFGPRDVPHTFVNSGQKPLRMLVVTRPAGFEKFFAEAGDALVAAGKFDTAVLAQVAAKYGIEILGPPLS